MVAPFAEVVAESDENDARVTQIEQDYEVDIANDNTVLANGLPNLITAIEGYLEPVGSQNTALGVAALLTNEAGSSNTAVGFAALTAANAVVDTVTSESGDYTNVIGAFGNSALGVNALAATSLGSLNTAMGMDALKNATGDTSNNTAVGAASMENMVDGYTNTAVGYRAMYSSSGSADAPALLRNNIALGAFAMNFTQDGKRNVGVGVSALSDNRSDDNTAVGYWSLTNNRTGSSNTAVGASALQRSNSGVGNTAVGDRAMTTLTTGNYNAAVGHLASVFSTGLTNATAIGYQATASADNEIRLGNADVEEVVTAGKLTLDAVTYPNVDGNPNDVLVTNGAGLAEWKDIGSLPRIAAREKELWDRIAQLEQTLTNQQQEMLAVIARQQEQLAQIERLVSGEHFVAR